MRLETLVIPIRFDESGFDGSLSSIQGKLSSFATDAAVFGALSGIGIAYVDFLKSTIGPAAEAETAHVRLVAALHATGRDSEISAVQLEAMATQLMKLSTFDDEAIKNAFQTLSQFPSIPVSAFENLTKAAMDLSAATGSQLQPNIEALGRALETGVIPRTFNFSAALKEQFKDQIAAGDSAGALITMMDGLSRYTGQATAEVGTYHGQVKILNNNWDEFKEGIGGKFIPGLTDLLGWVNKNFEGITNFVSVVYSVLNPLGKLAELIASIDWSKVWGGVNWTPGKPYTPWGNHASGGLAGGMTWVGERGPELVNLPGGSYVHSAQQSQGMSQIDYDRMGRAIAQHLVPALQVAGFG